MLQMLTKLLLYLR
ncbi:hypothetical protein LINPERHAP1_LOCUS1609 [Linum perenne]